MILEILTASFFFSLRLRGVVAVLLLVSSIVHHHRNHGMCWWLVVEATTDEEPVASSPARAGTISSRRPTQQTSHPTSSPAPSTTPTMSSPPSSWPSNFPTALCFDVLMIGKLLINMYDVMPLSRHHEHTLYVPILYFTLDLNLSLAYPKQPINVAMTGRQKIIVQFKMVSVP